MKNDSMGWESIYRDASDNVKQCLGRDEFLKLLHLVT